MKNGKSGSKQNPIRIESGQDHSTRQGRPDLKFTIVKAPIPSYLAEAYELAQSVLRVVQRSSNRLPKQVRCESAPRSATRINTVVLSLRRCLEPTWSPAFLSASKSDWLWFRTLRSIGIPWSCEQFLHRQVTNASKSSTPYTLRACSSSDLFLPIRCF